MTASLKAGVRTSLETVGTFADGAAVRTIGAETFRICNELVDEMVTPNPNPKPEPQPQPSLQP